MSPWPTPVRSPDLAELETLVVCAGEGSFAAAAEQLRISRPAVAKRIANVEALAGQQLFARGGRGIRLTDAGATLLAGARRILDERDELLHLIRELRGDEVSAISGLRSLLGHATGADRAAQRPEARLVETERVLEFILRATTSAVAISDLDTSVIHEVNDAFCSFVGHPREALLGRPATAVGTWLDENERVPLAAQLRAEGAYDRRPIRVRRPDGTIRAGESSAVLISLAGRERVLSTIDDVTERRRAELERSGTIVGYTAIAEFAVQATRARPATEALGAALPALRQCGEFSTALVWEHGAQRAALLDGEEPWPELPHALAEARAIPDSRASVICPPGARGGPKVGFAVELAPLGQSVVLLSERALPDSSQRLVARLLTLMAEAVAPGAER